MSQTDPTVATAPGLGPWDRLACAFTAPSRTFDDIRNGYRSWWLPFLILALTGYMLFAVVAQRVSVQQAVRNQIQMSPRAQEQMARAAPEQAENIQRVWVGFTQAAFLAAPLTHLLYALVIAGVVLATINFCFGGRARFGEVLAVTYYAWLPAVLKALMGIAVLWFQPPELFNIKNFAPTNPAALFLDPATAPPVLYVFAGQLDIVTIWTLVLLSIGLATVARVRRSYGYITVFGWWAIVVLFQIGMTAAFD